MHFFEESVAKKYGIEEAVIFENLCYWCEYNWKNKNNIFNGKAWTYNSVSAFQEIYSYMSTDKIGRVLKHLESEGLIESGCFNLNTYDRTKWYTITAYGKEVYNTSKRLSNGSNVPEHAESPAAEEHKEEKKPVNKSKKFQKPTVEEIKAYCELKHYNVDAETFYNFYESKGWMVGKSPMKSWTACIATWVKNSRQNNGTKQNISSDTMTEEKSKSERARIEKYMREQGL